MEIIKKGNTLIEIYDSKKVATTYNAKKKIVMKKYYIKHNDSKWLLHNDKGAALIGMVNTRYVVRYYNNGKIHREDGPAEYITSLHMKILNWYTNNLLHSRIYDNELKPAKVMFIHNSVVKEVYYKKGKYHNDIGPAYIEYDLNKNITKKRYYLNGKKTTKDKVVKQYTNIVDCVLKKSTLADYNISKLITNYVGI